MAAHIYHQLNGVTRRAPLRKEVVDDGRRSQFQQAYQAASFQQMLDDFFREGRRMPHVQTQGQACVPVLSQLSSNFMRKEVLLRLPCFNLQGQYRRLHSEK